MAYQLAEKKSNNHPFVKENDKAGLDWVYKFIKTHCDLSIRKPEATSAARASGFNPIVVGKLYTQQVIQVIYPTIWYNRYA